MQELAVCGHNDGVVLGIVPPDAPVVLAPDFHQLDFVGTCFSGWIAVRMV